jgi:tetratricopeptide (TPR) repeat protein
MVSWGSAELVAKWRFRKIGLGVLAIIVLVGLFPLTRAQVKRWQNSRVLFSHAIEVTENNYVAHNCLGMALQTEGELNEAIKQFRRVLQIKPEHLETRTNLGAALLAQGKAHDAIRCFREALRIKPDSVNALNNLAWVMAAYPDKGFYNPAEAVRLAAKACRLTGFEHPESLDTLAVAYGAIGKFAEAVETGTKGINLGK